MAAEAARQERQPETQAKQQAKTSFSVKESVGLEAWRGPVKRDEGIGLALTQSMLQEAATLASKGQAGRLSPDELELRLSNRFTLEEIHRLVCPARTLARRKANREALSIEETERALRLARIAVEAERVFANPDKAARWLRRANRVFNDHAPLSLLETETGARAVEELLGQIDHGIFV